MSKLICKKCGGEISNEFGVTLSYCTNCGAALQNFHSFQTLEFKRNDAAIDKPKNKFWFGLIAGGFFAFVLIGGIYLLNNYLSGKENAGSTNNPVSKPLISLPKFSSVSASEITEVTLSSWQHFGLLYSGDGSVQSSSITFRRDGSVSSIRQTNFDDGKKTDISTEKAGNISAQDFELLAESLVENDFFDQTDSKERVSERDKSLKVKFSGREKEVKPSNIGKDTPEIKAVLEVITNLENRIKWNAKN